MFYYKLHLNKKGRVLGTNIYIDSVLCYYFHQEKFRYRSLSVVGATKTSNIKIRGKAKFNENIQLIF